MDPLALMVPTFRKSNVVATAAALTPGTISTIGCGLSLLPMTVKVIPVSSPPEVMRTWRWVSSTATPATTEAPLSNKFPAAVRVWLLPMQFTDAAISTLGTLTGTAIG